MNRFAVLIPALNCEATIASVVEHARAFAQLVVLVDDGSQDRTSAQAAAAGACVIRHDRCRGKGAALASGLLWAAEQQITHVVTMDGDGEHLASEIPVLLKQSMSHPAAIVIGARDRSHVAISRVRLFGNRFADRWVEIACGLKIPDTQSGFRVYPVDRVVSLGVRARRFAYETELLIRARRAEVPVECVSVRVNYRDPATRKSHYRGFVDTVQIIFVVLALIFRVW